MEELGTMRTVKMLLTVENVTVKDDKDDNQYARLQAV